jgi:hypothetical protein
MNHNIGDNPRHPRRVYRNISQKYCSHVDDNVIVVKDTSVSPERYECLSAHLCGCRNNNAVGAADDCVHNMQ